MTAKEQKGAPDLDLVMEVFEGTCTPTNANEEQREAMKFFLVHVLESVSPKLKNPKSWALGNQNHLGFFGASWRYEMATAGTLVKHYSDTTNIEYNIEQSETGETRPKKKQRMQNKGNEAEISRSYYDLVRRFGKLANSEGGFDERMKLWDDYCLQGRRTSKNTERVVMTNVIPQDQREEQHNNNCSGMAGLGFDTFFENGFGGVGGYSQV